MSRHGPLGRGGDGEPAPRPSLPTASQRWVLGLRVAGREAQVGFVLWCCASTHYEIRFLAFALVFVILVAATKRFGFSHPTSWRGALVEAAFVFWGSLGVANLVVLLHGPAPWVAGG